MAQMRPIVKLALACLAMFLAIKARTGLAKHMTREDEEQYKDIYLDAFDPDKCGAANFRPWQREQSVFECQAPRQRNDLAPNETSFNLLGHPDPALPGEFPFYVRIKAVGSGNGGANNNNNNRSVKLCSGVLVSRDIVITTAADCLGAHLYEPDEGKAADLDQVYLQLGANVQDDPESVHRTGQAWCTAPTESEDLAVIKLSKPVMYVPGKIGPACLVDVGPGGPNLIPHGHKTARPHVCVLAASCYTLDKIPMFPSCQSKPFITSSGPMVPTDCDDGDPKFPHASCFRRTYPGYPCKEDRGSPVVCYDTCKTKKANKVRAYVYGVLSHSGRKLINKKSTETTSVVDFQKARLHILKLLRALKEFSYEEGAQVPSGNIKCRNGNYPNGRMR